MASFEGGCSISVRSLTQFKTEDELKVFIEGPLAKVIFSDFLTIRKAELQGIANDQLDRDADALLELESRGVEVSCTGTVRF